MQTPSIRERLQKRCPHPVKRILIPLAILGSLGFFINSRVSLNSFHYCSPKTNIVLLKTHKCAGSTIQNILMRYGDTHNLSFVLPKKDNYIGHPEPFKEAFLSHPLLPTYNILAHHTRLNYTAIQELMPSNTVYITIIREPAELFESMYSYYNLEKYSRCNIHQFIKSEKMCKFNGFKVALKKIMGTNQMSFDLGMDKGMFENDSMIQDYLNQLDSWFDLVLVAERMDESLILMRHLLCWNIEDVVAFKLNSRNNKYKTRLSEDEKMKLREMSRADVLLYNRFLSKFEAQVDVFGRERMDQETSELRRRTRMWYEMCVSKEYLQTTPRTPTKVYINPKVFMFEARNANNETCTPLTTPEMDYTDYLRKKQGSHPALKKRRWIKQLRKI